MKYGTDRIYEEGYELTDNEYLFKYKPNSMGFITKLNKDGSIPKAFTEWNEWGVGICPIYIHTEEPREGWEIVNIRIGKSQYWAILRHPLGFCLEIYLTDLINLITGNTNTHTYGGINVDKLNIPIDVIGSKLKGKFAWYQNKLIENHEYIK